MTDDLSQVALVGSTPRELSQKRSDVYQNYMDHLLQFRLVLGRFVTKLFWDISSTDCDISDLVETYRLLRLVKGVLNKKRQSRQCRHYYE